jgi:hypothetical protein
MKTTPEAAEVLEEFFDDVRTEYSGRGMYGSNCLGIVTGDSGFSLAQTLMEAREEADEADEDVRELLDAMLSREPRTDSMGLDTIYYWPGIQVEEDNDD